MRSAVRLGTGSGFSLDAVTCHDDHRGWSPPEMSSAYRVVLVHRGRFRRKADGRATVVDPTMAYLGVPGQEEHFAHPAGGDVCTSLCVSPDLWCSLAGDGVAPSRSIAGGSAAPSRSTIYVDARLDLAHRRFLAAARTGDTAFELAEALLPLVSTALAQLAPMPVRRGRAPASSEVIVEGAREAIAAGHPAADGLLPLAEFLAVSPYQLSRAFTRELGVSLTHYRNRVRVGRALDHLEGGAANLALLAAELGFADQAHLTRTIRRHAGRTPAALRRLLAPQGPLAEGPRRDR